MNDTCCIEFQAYILFHYKETYIASILLQKDRKWNETSMNWD